MHLPRTKKRRISVLLSALALIAAAIAVGVATSAQPPESGLGVDSHVEHADIWSVDVQTRKLTRQTLYADAIEPSWSPDGDIAFSTADCDECESEIHIDGASSSEVPVVTNVRHLFQPSWAPDGNRVATVRLGRGIWSLDVANRTSKRLTTGAADEAPAWSPNGDWIAYDKHVEDTNYDLYAVNADTGQRRRLTRDAAAQTNPAWSPDGSRLAFAEQQSNGRWAIFSMGFDGNGRKRVTGSQISAQEPSWSPDGKKIAFILQGLDSATVAVINADGSGNVTRLTDGSLLPSRPTWSPDSASVGFSALVVPQ
jgi:TolB protein